jgi:hypothetical protein
MAPEFPMEKFSISKLQFFNNNPKDRIEITFQAKNIHFQGPKGADANVFKTFLNFLHFHLGPISFLEELKFIKI